MSQPDYKEWLQNQGYSKATVKSYYKTQRHVTRWLAEEGLSFNAGAATVLCRTGGGD